MDIEKCGRTDEVRDFTLEWGIEKAVLQEWFDQNVWHGKVT